MEWHINYNTTRKCIDFLKKTYNIDEYKKLYYNKDKGTANRRLSSNN